MKTHFGYTQFFLIISDYLFKLLLIGDSGVGKSCLLLRFAVSIVSKLINRTIFAEKVFIKFTYVVNEFI